MFNLIDSVRKFISNHRAKAEDVFLCEVYDPNGEKIFATHDIDEFLTYWDGLCDSEAEGEEPDEKTEPCDGRCECGCGCGGDCGVCLDNDALSDGETLYAELAERTETPVAGILAASALIASLASLIIAVRKK